MMSGVSRPHYTDDGSRAFLNTAEVGPATGSSDIERIVPPLPFHSLSKPSGSYIYVSVRAHIHIHICIHEESTWRCRIMTVTYSADY